MALRARTPAGRFQFAVQCPTLAGPTGDHKCGCISVPEGGHLSALWGNQIGRCLFFFHTIFRFFQVTPIQFARSDEETNVYRYTSYAHAQNPIRTYGHLLDPQTLS